MNGPFPLPHATSHTLRRIALTVWVVFVAGRLAAAPPAGGFERSFPLPILTVDAENRGHVARPRLTVVRSVDAATPLSLAIVEDTPGGAGESVRASIWLAAMVAALDRMDPLDGMKVSLELSGAVDGPSAGAGLCLAILSALDGRDFPADCAATGAIMPDGTIGGVGGLAPKLRAAAAAGIRRVVVPTYLRFEKQPDIAEEVDLKRLAKELKLELIAVENVTQAYAALHRLTATPRLPPPRSVLELPEPTEEVLKQRYQLHRQAGIKLWNAIPEADKAQLAADPNAKQTFIDTKHEAESAYRTGRLGWAATQAWVWHIALDARKTHLAYLAQQKPEQLMPADPAEGIARTKRRLVEIESGVAGSDSLLATSPTGSEAGAQLWGGFYEYFGMKGIIDLLQPEIDRQLGESRRTDLKPDELKTLRQQLFENQQIQLVLAQLVAEANRTWREEQAALIATLPLRPIVERPEGVERLFYNAHLAIRNTFRHDVLGSLAAQYQASPTQVFDSLKGLDIRATMQEPAVLAADKIHARALVANDPTVRRFALAASTFLQAEAAATQSALIVRWSQLDAETDDDGSFVYGRTDLLNYLITTARENALRAIEQCREKDLIPLGPITRFEAAEMVRDDTATDKVEVLAAYWSASLQAKVLLMLCGETKNQPPPAPSTKQARQAPSPQPNQGSNGLWRSIGGSSSSLLPTTTVPRPLGTFVNPGLGGNSLSDRWGTPGRNGSAASPGPYKWPWASIAGAWFFWYLFSRFKAKKPA